ncbi:MAG TPA: 4'-phosphopantetheinyl transferase superfamily protein [Noviherbaspirillum sp.]|nr:4'-phosphopantetheinyl transferase superfamily protein [Noviherbaspirillum sp.]
MSAASPLTSAPIDLKVDAESPLDLDYPELAEGSALCIGLSFDWRHQTALHSFALKNTLQDEHARAARFPRQEDSIRNLLGRTMLRRAAAHYGGMDPTQIIRSNTWGKPDLPGCKVGCNVSHAGSQVWVAVSTFPRVGIDIELTNGPQEYHDLAAGLHPDEIAALRRMPDGKVATIRCWSRKEAISKATGMGVALPLRAYAVECDRRPSDWLRLPPPRTVCEDWTTVDLPVAKDYVGALAIEGRCDRITVLRLKVS